MEEIECGKILDTLPDGISVHDLSFNIVHANQALANILGMSKQELIGKKCYQVFHGLSGPIVNCPHVKAIKTGKPAYLRLEETYLGGRVLKVSSTPLLGEGDSAQYVGSVHIVRDITEQERLARGKKQALEDLKRSNTELERFAFIASHDLQEPLRMVASYVQLLQKRYQEKLDQRADEYIAFAIEGASRMQAMINDLLAYSRQSAHVRSFEPIDLEKSLHRVLSTLAYAVKECKAEVTHDPLPTVLADPAQITLLLQNLVDNAIKFRRKGIAPHVHVSAEKQDEEWTLCVRDNGTGIDPKYFEKIFFIFERLHPREKYPGTGIGLAICKRTVERFGGRIWVESEPGKGSTFCFTIPGDKI